MAEYHVGAGLFGIYAGILKNKQEWRNKTTCTDEAIEAVRDYMYQEFVKNGNASGAYEGDRKDGNIVELRLSVKSPNNKPYNAY